MTVFARSLRHISSSRARSCGLRHLLVERHLDELPEPDVRDLAVAHRVQRAVHGRPLGVEDAALQRHVHASLLRHARPYSRSVPARLPGGLLGCGRWGRDSREIAALAARRAGAPRRHGRSRRRSRRRSSRVGYPRAQELAGQPDGGRARPGARRAVRRPGGDRLHRACGRDLLYPLRGLPRGRTSGAVLLPGARWVGRARRGARRRRSSRCRSLRSARGVGAAHGEPVALALARAVPRAPHLLRPARPASCASSRRGAPASRSRRRRSTRWSARSPSTRSGRGAAPRRRASSSTTCSSSATRSPAT